MVDREEMRKEARDQTQKFGHVTDLLVAQVRSYPHTPSGCAASLPPVRMRELAAAHHMGVLWWENNPCDQGKLLHAISDSIGLA